MVKVFEQGASVEEMIEWLRFGVSTNEKSYAICSDAIACFEPVWDTKSDNSPYFKVYEVSEVGPDN